MSLSSAHNNSRQQHKTMNLTEEITTEVGPAAWPSINRVATNRKKKAGPEFFFSTLSVCASPWWQTVPISYIIRTSWPPNEAIQFTIILTGQITRVPPDVNHTNNTQTHTRYLFLKIFKQEYEMKRASQKEVWTRPIPASEWERSSGRLFSLPTLATSQTCPSYLPLFRMSSTLFTSFEPAGSGLMDLIPSGLFQLPSRIHRPSFRTIGTCLEPRKYIWKKNLLTEYNHIQLTLESFVSIFHGRNQKEVFFIPERLNAPTPNFFHKIQRPLFK